MVYTNVVYLFIIMIGIEKSNKKSCYTLLIQFHFFWYKNPKIKYIHFDVFRLQVEKCLIFCNTYIIETFPFLLTESESKWQVKQHESSVPLMIMSDNKGNISRAIASIEELSEKAYSKETLDDPIIKKLTREQVCLKCTKVVEKL